MKLIDTDGDGVPDERKREVEADDEVLERSYHEVRRDGRWKLLEMEDYRSCTTTGNYRQVKYLGGARKTVEWHSCIVS